MTKSLPDVDNGTWLSALSIAVKQLQEINNKIIPALEVLDIQQEDGKRQIIIHDLLQGITLDLCLSLNDGLLFVEARSLERPVPSSPDLALLALSCNDRPPFIDFTLGVDAVGRPGPLWSPSHRPSTYPILTNLLNEIIDIVSRERDRQDLSRYALGANLWYTEGTRPWQAYGEWQGYPFHFRMRGSVASLSFALPGQDPAEQPAWQSGFEYTPILGHPQFHEFVLIFCYLASKIKRTEFPYEFEVLEYPVELENKNLLLRTVVEDKVITLRGHTPEKAYALIEQSEFKGWKLNPQPLNTDPRVFPENDPVFPIAEEALEKGIDLILDIDNEINLRLGWT